MAPYHIRALAAGALVLAVGIPFGAVSAAQACDDEHEYSAPDRQMPSDDEHEDSTPDEQTMANLETAMKGEAYAHAMYSFFAAQADRENLAPVARLFLRTAETELGEHFAEAAAMSGLDVSDEDDLESAMEGEGYEMHTMYPTFAEQARQDGEPEAAKLFDEIAGDEAKHHAAFLKALQVLRTGEGTIPGPPALDAMALKAGMPKVRAKRTLANLETAMRGEAMAHAKYMTFAKHAEKNGHEALARLFSGTAMVELKEHFAEEGQLAGLVRTTRENLNKAIAGETYESRTMYPTFAKQARELGDDDEAYLFDHNAEDEAEHARAFEKALDELD